MNHQSGHHTIQQIELTMEEIAFISDLACNSIESGEYHIALDALNGCLTCVKKLRDCRRSTGAGSGTETVPSSPANRAEEGNVWNVLKEIKEKLLRSTKAAASIAVSTTTTAITSGGTSKRKFNDDNDSDNTGCVCVCVSESMTFSPTEASPAEKGTSVVLQQSRKRRRGEHQETPDEDRGEGNQQVATGVIVEQECACSICPSLSDTATVTLTTSENMYRGSSSCNLAHSNNNHGNHGEKQCPNKTNSDNTIDDDEDDYTSSFVYSKPFRLTKSQWNQIREYREFLCQLDCRIMLCPCQPYLQQEGIEREILLVVSSNLIFNIALSHHLIAETMTSTTASTTSGTAIPKYHSHTSDHEDDCNHKTNDNADACWDSDDDSNYDSDSDYDDDTEDGEDVDGMECGSNALTREQRLEGALRLYELAITICDKQISTAAPPSPLPLSILPQVTTAFFEQQQQFGRDIGTSGSAPNKSSNHKDDELRIFTQHYLALTNNCAHIHESLGRNDRATVFRNRLLQFMSVLTYSGGSIHEIVGEDAVLNGYLKSVFWGNIFSKERVVAPAA